MNVVRGASRVAEVGEQDVKKHVRDRNNESCKMGRARDGVVRTIQRCEVEVEEDDGGVLALPPMPSPRPQPLGGGFVSTWRWCSEIEIGVERAM